MSYSTLGTPPSTVDIYPSWPTHFIEVVEKAITVAWSVAIKDKPALIQTEDEDIITTELKTILVKLWRDNTIQGFGSKQFGLPTRDSKLPDFTGKSIDKMPDLTFYLANPRCEVSDVQYDALFFECKVLGKNKGMDKYAGDGIERFIDAKYAWRMNHAGMIAYDFKASKLDPQTRLHNYFKLSSRRKSGLNNYKTFYCVGNPINCSCISTKPNKNKMAITIHSRPIMGNTKNTNITLRHIWLKN